MSLTYLRDVLPWSVAQPWFHVRLKFRSTAHLTWLETRDETAQTHEKPDPDLLETNNASFLHPHREGHLIISASVPAQMLIRCRGGNTPLRPAGITELLSSHCHSHTFDCTITIVREMKRSLFLSFFLFFFLPVRCSGSQCNSRSVGHTGSAARIYRNDETSHATPMRCHGARAITAVRSAHYIDLNKERIKCHPSWMSSISY